MKIFSFAWDWIFRGNPIGEFLDDKKSIISLVLIIVAALMDNLSVFMAHYPNTEILGQIYTYIKNFLGSSESFLEMIGYTLGTFGLADKYYKFKTDK